MSAEIKAIAPGFIEEVWNRGNLDVVDKMVADNYAHRDPVGRARPGPEGFKEYVNLCRTAFPDLHVAIEDTFSDGNMVMVRWKSCGTHRGNLMGIQATDKQVSLSGITVFHISEGKLLEEWTNCDPLGLMRVLVLIPG